MVIDDKAVKIATLLLTVAAGYFAVKYTGEHNTAAIEDHKTSVKLEMNELKAAHKGIDNRLRELETTTPMMANDISHIKETIDELKPLLLDSLRK